MNIKKIVTGFYLTLSLLFFDCATPRHNVKTDAKDNELTLIIPMFVDILTIDNLPLDNYGRPFLIEPGTRNFKVMFSSGRIRSKGFKEITINANPGESYALCSYADVQLNSFQTVIEKNGGWIAFFAIIQKDELASLKLGLGYDGTKIQNQICNREINSKNLLNQLKNQ